MLLRISYNAWNERFKKSLHCAAEILTLYANSPGQQNIIIEGFIIVSDIVVARFYCRNLADAVKLMHNLGFDLLDAADVMESIQMDYQPLEDESLSMEEEKMKLKKMCKLKNLHLK